MRDASRILMPLAAGSACGTPHEQRGLHPALGATERLGGLELASGHLYRGQAGGHFSVSGATAAAAVATAMVTAIEPAAKAF